MLDNRKTFNCEVRNPEGCLEIFVYSCVQTGQILFIIMNSLGLEKFQIIDANPGGTLQKFTEYIEQIELLFQLTFRKTDGSYFEPSDNDKKAMLLFKGGKDMKTLFKHVGKVLDSDSYAQSVKKVSDGLSARTNKVVQRNKLFSNFPQGSKSFEKWSVEISNAAQLIDYSDYSWQQAAVDAMVLQTSNAKLRERALQDNVNYDTLMTLGVAKEQSARGAATMEKLVANQAKLTRRKSKWNRRCVGCMKKIVSSKGRKLVTDMVSINVEEVQNVQLMAKNVENATN